MNIFQSTMIYVVAILLTILLLMLNEKNKCLKNIKNKNLILKFLINFLCFLPLICLFSFRNYVGTDYYTYENMFNYLLDKPKTLESILRHYIEPGWVVLMYLSSYISKTFLFFKVFIGSVFFGYLTKLIEDKKFKSKILYVILTYIILFFPFMNITRQALACIILFYAFKKYLNKEYFLVIINFLFAVSIHKSSILFLGIILFHYLYKKFNVSEKKKINNIIEYSLLLSPIYVIPFSKFLAMSFEKINFKSYYVYETFNLNIKFLLYTLPIIVIYKYIVKKYSIDTKKNNIQFIYYITLVSILFQSLGCLFLMFERLSIYLFSFNIILFPLVLNEINLKKIRVFYYLVYGYFIVYFLIMYVILNGQGCFPYQFI